MTNFVPASRTSADAYWNANEQSINTVPEAFGAATFLSPLPLHPRHHYPSMPLHHRAPQHDHRVHGHPPSSSLLFREQAWPMPGTTVPSRIGAPTVHSSPALCLTIHPSLQVQGSAFESLLLYQDLPCKYNAPAVVPAVPALKVISDELPWELTVFAGASNFVRVKDVIRALRTFLEIPVSRSGAEFASLTEYERADVLLSFRARTQSSSGRDSLRRRDFLKARSLCGLEQARDGWDGACVLVLTPAPTWGAAF